MHVKFYEHSFPFNMLPDSPNRETIYDQSHSIRFFFYNNVTLIPDDEISNFSHGIDHCVGDPNASAKNDNLELCSHGITTTLHFEKSDVDGSSVDSIFDLEFSAENLKHLHSEGQKC